MTRIVSYNLYQCPVCDQIHIKPNYGSISSYVPIDFIVKPEDIKTCQKCNAKIAFNRFIFLSTERDKPPKSNIFYEQEIVNFLRYFKNFILCKNIVKLKQMSLSQMYPRLQD